MTHLKRINIKILKININWENIKREREKEVSFYKYMKFFLLKII